MTSNEFLLILSWVFNIVFSIVMFIYDIPLTENIKFGPVCIILIIFMILLYLLFKPFTKD